MGAMKNTKNISPFNWNVSGRISTFTCYLHEHLAPQATVQYNRSTTEKYMILVTLETVSILFSYSTRYHGYVESLMWFATAGSRVMMRRKYRVDSWTGVTRAAVETWSPPLVFTLEMLKFLATRHNCISFGVSFTYFTKNSFKRAWSCGWYLISIEFSFLCRTSVETRWLGHVLFGSAFPLLLFGRPKNCCVQDFLSQVHKKQRAKSV